MPIRINSFTDLKVLVLFCKTRLICAKIYIYIYASVLWLKHVNEIISLFFLTDSRPATLLKPKALYRETNRRFHLTSRSPFAHI